MRKLLTFTCLLGISIGCGQLTQSRKVSVNFLDHQAKSHSLTLSVKEKKRLHYLLQKLFLEDNFAYSLLGSKPMCWACYKKPIFSFSSWLSLFDTFMGYHYNMHLGWETWKKYRNQFPPSLLLWAENSVSSNNTKYISILLVNKKMFKKVVQKHQKDFQKILQNEKFTGDKIFSKIGKYTLLKDILNNHQALLGILLGYGRDNSWQFLEQTVKQGIPLGCVWSKEEEKFRRDAITSGKSDTETILSIFSCPSFAGNPNSEESKELKTNYLATLKKVCTYYKNRDFLEASLSLLAGFNPQD